MTLDAFFLLTAVDALITPNANFCHNKYEKNDIFFPYHELERT